MRFFSLKLALVGLLIVAAVTDGAAKKKKGSKKGKGKSTTDPCATELPRETNEDSKYLHQMTVTNGNTVCGGTWISKDIVITAGHCVVDQNNKKVDSGRVSVLTGIRDRNGLGLINGGTYQSVKEIVLHKGFKKIRAPAMRKPGSKEELESYFANDVAILKLAPPLDLLGLRSKEDQMEGKYAVLPEGKDAITAGQDVAFLAPMKGLGLFETRSGQLFVRDMKIIDKAECAKSDKMSDAKADVEAGKTICGTETCEEIDPKLCPRFTGGGLLCKGSGEQDVLCGVQLTHNCDKDKNLPQAYLNVAEYKDWVNEKIEELEV